MLDIQKPTKFSRFFIDFSFVLFPQTGAPSFKLPLFACICDGGFIHAKTMVGDRCWGCVGSANHDARSAAINFECNAMVYDPAFGTAMTEAFEHDLTECTEYTVAVHRSRSVFAKIKTAAALLLSREM